MTKDYVKKIFPIQWDEDDMKLLHHMKEQYSEKDYLNTKAAMMQAQALRMIGIERVFYERSK